MWGTVPCINVGHFINKLKYFILSILHSFKFKLMKTLWIQFPEKHWIFSGFAQILDSVQRLSFCSLKYSKLWKFQMYQTIKTKTAASPLLEKYVFIFKSSIISLRCNIIASVDLFPQVAICSKLSLMPFTFCRFAYRDSTCLAPKWCCIFYFSGLFVTVLTIVTLLRKSIFF